MHELSNIRWFSGIRHLGDTEKRAEELIKTYLTRLFQDAKKVSTFEVEWIEGDWALADSLERKRNIEFFNLWNEAGATAYRIAEQNGRLLSYEAMWNVVSKIVPLPNNPNRDNELDAYDGIQIMANYAASIVIEDITKTQNLNEPLVRLYLMGLWPRGIITITKKDMIGMALRDLYFENALSDSYLKGELPKTTIPTDMLIEFLLEILDFDHPLLKSQIEKRLPKQWVPNKFILFTPNISKKIVDKNIRKEDKVNKSELYRYKQENEVYRILGKVKKLSDTSFKAILKNQEDFLNTGGIGTIPANFQFSNISGCALPNLDLSYADFSHAILDGSLMPYSKFINANFEQASLIQAELTDSNMTYANLSYANLSESILKGVMFRQNDFKGTNFKYSVFKNTSFMNCDLSKAKGLDEVYFEGKSFLDVTTILNSKGRIPTEFLLNCNVPIDVIESIRQKVAKAENHSVFISYKHESKELKEWVKLLANRLLDNGVLAFLDQWEVKPGDSFTQYMEKGIKNSKYAIFVCSKKAISYANKRSGGIGYEAELLASLGIKRKIITIPILRGTKKVPTFLEGKYYLNFNSQDDSIKDEPFNELVHTILGHTKRPLLGLPIKPRERAR